MVDKPMEPEHAPAPRFLTDVILELGFTTSEKIVEAIEAARLTNTTAEQLLVEHGDITPDQLGHALAVRHGTEYIDLDSYQVDMEAAHQVTRTVARRCGVVPVAFAGADALVVAIYDSSGAAAAGDIAALTRMEVKPVVASRELIEALIEKLPEREVVRPGRDRRGGRQRQSPVEQQPQGEVYTNVPAQPATSPAQAPRPSQPPVQPTTPRPAAPLEGDLLERVAQLADPTRAVDLSPDLRLVQDAAAGASPEQSRQQLRVELDRLVALEQDFRATLEQVTERMRVAGALPGSSERIAELEEKLAAAESARDLAEGERDELRRRLAAIRDTLGHGG